LRFCPLQQYDLVTDLLSQEIVHATSP
jgi:hypothetical protein